MTLSEFDINQFLGGRLSRNIAPYIPKALLEPANHLLYRSGKKMRSRLVQIGFDCGPIKNGEVLNACQDLMERLHAGSLVIDDIEDGSSQRRGTPCVHHQFGLPTALNTGNFLYFWSLQDIAKMQVPASIELELYRKYHRALLLAHIGQSIDVGVRIDRVPIEQVYDLVLASLELKSGSLTELGLVLGAILSETEPRIIQELSMFGCHFGIALQMFDDIGNFWGNKEPIKRFEDLTLRRPSWIWAVIAKEFPQLMGGFREVVATLPNFQEVQSWASNNSRVLEKSRQAAMHFLTNALAELEHVPSDNLKELSQLSNELMSAYG